MERVAAATGKPNPTIWLPDYFCYDATAPLRQSGAVLQFYPVEAALRPDWAACRQIAGSISVDVFVLVHTFGHENDGTAARAFADGHGALLVEDAAHVLTSSGAIGAQGDAVFFSPHKWLPMPDGAILWARDGLTIPPIPPLITPTARWTLKRLIQSLLPAALQPSPITQGPQRFLEDPEPTDAVPEPGLSRVAMAMLGDLTRSDLDAIVAARRTNHAAWVLGLAAISDFHIHPAPDVPYRCVAEAPSVERAEAFFNALRAVKVPAESWPDMPPSVSANPKQHETAIGLRHRLVMLPVHQDLTAAEITQACSFLVVPA